MHLVCILNAFCFLAQGCFVVCFIGVLIAEQMAQYVIYYMASVGLKIEVGTYADKQTISGVLTWKLNNWSKCLLSCSYELFVTLYFYNAFLMHF